jgi:uncharacterized membrane protein
VRHRLELGVLLLASVAGAQTPPLVCYGNEPSWSLELSEAAARLKVPGEEEVEFAGASTAIAALKVQAWRGRLPGGRPGDLVAFLTEAACTDGMSDVKRPYSARVSLPDGRLFAGCCRPDTMRSPRATSGAPALGSTLSPSTSPGSEPKKAGGPPPSTGPDWAHSILEFLPALRMCVYENMRTEAVVYAEALGKGKFHLVLRLQGRRYADCETTGTGPARVSGRKRGGTLTPAEEVALVTLLPGDPPRGPCDVSEPALDDRGNPFGWITRKGC